MARNNLGAVFLPALPVHISILASTSHCIGHTIAIETLISGKQNTCLTPVQTSINCLGFIKGGA